MDESKIRTVEENGVHIPINEYSDKPSKCKTFYNPVMKICREFVLCNVAAFTLNSEKPPLCLDAFGATGVGGLQWKHHLGDKIRVSINELNPESVLEIKKNCIANGLHPIDVPESTEVADASKSQGMRNGTSAKQMDTESPDGDELSSTSAESIVEVIKEDANITMHHRQFNFINLDPYGTTVPYLDAAFRNLYNKGVMVLTSTDIASLYGKCPQVTTRNYSAYTIKTDYMKELAARIALGVAAKAAARCHKGIRVLHSVGAEHFVQVSVQVVRGVQQADNSLLNIRRVLHCQMCQDWALLPDTRAPVEDPYSLLPCDCHNQNPGKTAVEVGPLWAGPLFDVDYLDKMKAEAKRLKLSERVQSLLDLMLTEVKCTSADITKTNENGTTSSEHSGSKRSAEDSQPTSAPAAKKHKPNRELTPNEMPLFYYNLHRRKFKGGNLPKYQKLVSTLQNAGFKASRTHFDTECIRTDATLAELTSFVCNREDKL